MMMKVMIMMMTVTTVMINRMIEINTLTLQ